MIESFGPELLSKPGVTNRIDEIAAQKSGLISKFLRATSDETLDGVSTEALEAHGGFYPCGSSVRSGLHFR